MKQELIVKEEVLIAASIEMVWDALTNPEQTKKYMFGCRVITDWKVGNSILWNGIAEGKEVTYVKGHIAAIRPNEYLAYTTFDAHATIPDLPENYTTVTYSLSKRGNQTLLAITQGDFATVAEGQRRYNEVTSDDGWMALLMEIKKIVES
jgi:uncharacterized protein YndB with AHSA1/START domain